MIAQRREQAGFTLVELMVSLVVFSFAIAGVLAVAVSMAQGYRDQRGSVGAEASARIPMDMIADVLRQASPGAPTGTIEDLALCPATGSAVSFSTSAGVSNNNTGLNGSDVLDVIYASGGVVTSTQQVYDPTATTSLTVLDQSQLLVGDYIVVSNLFQGSLVKITGPGTTGSTPTSKTLTLGSTCGNNAPSGGYAAGSLVIRAVHARFLLQAVDGISTLIMNPTGDPTKDSTSSSGEPLAEGIEDFQVAYALDGGNSSADSITEVGAAANDDNWLYNFAGDTAGAGSTPALPPTSTIRAIRVTIVASTTTAWTGSAASGTFSRPAAEDHAAGTTLDNYRRRVLRTIAEIRDIGESP